MVDARHEVPCVRVLQALIHRLDRLLEVRRRLDGPGPPRHPDPGPTTRRGSKHGRRGEAHHARMGRAIRQEPVGQEDADEAAILLARILGRGRPRGPDDGGIRPREGPLPQPGKRVEVRDPLLRFIEDVAPKLEKISKEIVEGPGS